MKLLDTFKYKKHECLVLERLSVNLYELIKQSQFKGLSLAFVRSIGWQVLVALCLLSMPSVNIIHCDLKPENIMLKNEGKTGVKIIDFGSAVYANKKSNKYV